jgi:hypothetical protein
MNKIILSLALLFGISFLNSCKDDDTAVSSRLTGDLTGNVILVNSDMNTVQDRSGATVSAEGTTFSAMTDTAGYWTIKGLPAGTYSVSFTKPGYDIYKNTSFQFVGGGLLWFELGSVTLYQPPSYTITLDTIKPRSISRDSVADSISGIYGHFSVIPSDAKPLSWRIIISKDPNPSIDPTTEVDYFDFQSGNGSYAGKNPNDFIIDLGYFNFSNIQSGQTLYVRAYPTGNGLRGYFDVKTHSNVYTGYGAASNILSFRK